MSDASMMLAAIGDYFEWWQAPLLLVLIGIIIFWIRYRKSQM